MEHVSGPVWLASGKNCMQTFACVWQKKIHVFGKLLHANSRCAGPDDLGGLTQSTVGPTNGPIPCPRCFHCHNQTHTIQATEFFPLQQPNKALILNLLVACKGPVWLFVAQIAQKF